MSADQQPPPPHDRKPPELRRTVIPLVLVMLGMAGMAWAAVPLYNLFCRVTGYAGTTQVAEQGADRILDREVTILFDASITRGMPWEFRPLQTRMKVHIGETAIAFYEAYNPTDRVIAGSATYNVTPYSVGPYFTKIECFCFTEQVLKPHQRATMPVTFYVDPEMVDDDEAKGVTTITLSYTFFRDEQDSEPAADRSIQPLAVN